MNFITLHAAFPNSHSKRDSSSWDSVPTHIPLHSILFVRAALPAELSDNVQSVVVLHGQGPDLLVRESLGLIESEIAKEQAKVILAKANEHGPMVTAFNQMVRAFLPPPQNETEGEDA